MRIVYIQTNNKPGDLIAGWWQSTREALSKEGGDAIMAVKFHHNVNPAGWIMIGNSVACGIHNRIFQYTGLQDMFSFFSTRKFLKQLDSLQPDIIHCHILNDYFLHLGLFCKYVNEHNVKVVWTFHDARVLTGQCPYPGYIGCNQWKETCKQCPKGNRHLQPSKEWVNMVSLVHEYRKKTIGSIQHLTIVTPSRWMASLVGQSYLKNVRCEVINNGINREVFSPHPYDIKKKYGVSQTSKVLLTVANPIGTLKGRDYLLKLIADLPSNYCLFLVGCLPSDVLYFSSFENVWAFTKVERHDLVGFYSSADLFVNPTLADNFPTVNLEAQACGCPVVAFDSDGTPETVAPKGRIVPRKDFEAFKNAILNFDYEGAKEDAIQFASQFSQETCVQKYLDLYKAVLQ